MIIRCKMCAGTLAFEEGSTVCECEYCGLKQTIPNADNEKKTNLFNRANRLRMNSEFDKASAVYESIVAEFPEEAEAYWGLCLCAYGIEYVDDPATGAKKPTCHRTLPLSIMEDANFEQACDCADGIARRVYRDEAKAIDRIQRDILSIAATEKPYDVFICYKETTETGGRTEDSVLAQDIYEALTAKGLKVFFSRITLEDKLGVQYEPYIYAALSSAKVMLAIGTQFEYYDAVWVKNEWSRFFKMAQNDRTKTLIPCFKDLDAYDMPKEFKGLQAQDMAKLGWLQDLVRGVEKLCGKGPKAEPVSAVVREVVKETRSNAANLMERAKLFLEDGNFGPAKEYLEKVLDEDAKYAPAYVGLVLVSERLKREEQLANLRKNLDNDANWQKALRFATPEQKVVYEGYAASARANETVDIEAAEEKKIAAKKQYEADLEIWRKNRSKVKGLREEKVKEHMSEERKKLENAAKERYELTISACNEKVAACEKMKTEAESILSKLGFFDLAEKSNQKKVIKKAENCIAIEKKKISDAENEYRDSLNEAEKSVAEKENEIRRNVEKECPFLKIPIEPELFKQKREKEEENEIIKDLIREVVSNGDGYTITNLIEYLPTEWSNQRVTAVVRQMEASGDLVREVIKRFAYFSAREK